MERIKLNKNFLYVVLGLILVSLIAHILLFDINNISRIYFGTDTRAFFSTCRSRYGAIRISYGEITC